MSSDAEGGELCGADGERGVEREVDVAGMREGPARGRLGEGERGPGRFDREVMAMGKSKLDCS